MSTKANPTILYEPPSGSEAFFDIVFVHGLGGDAIETWTEDTCCWPRDLLHSDFPQSRVLTWGYDSRVARLKGATSETSIFGHAESLLNSVARRRDVPVANQIERPIIFIGHSLGGLVVKQALIRAAAYHQNKQNAKLGAIYTSTIGVIFLGTPHRGSEKTGLGQLVANAAKATMLLSVSTKLLNVLAKDSEILENQRLSFDSVSENMFKVCLYESMKMKGYGMVVPEWSATMDGFKIKREAIPNKDHSGMCKFTGRNEDGYEIVTSYIRDCLREAMGDRGPGTVGSMRDVLQNRRGVVEVDVEEAD